VFLSVWDLVGSGERTYRMHFVFSVILVQGKKS
jgi:hypothetical protein